MKHIQSDLQASTLAVAKVGGSLFALPDLADRLRAWFRDNRQSVVFVAGGGEWVEAVQERADARFGLGEGASHWLAVCAMRITATLLQALLPDALFVDKWPIDRMALCATQATILDPWDFLQADAAREFGDPLPQNWAVTSDSIAARLAKMFVGADELVLMKSCPAPPEASPAALARLGLVDEYFPQAAQGLTLRWVNLRAT